MGINKPFINFASIVVNGLKTTNMS
jgi:hypothetical protein